MIVGHVVKRLVRGMAVGMVRRWFTSLLALGLIGGLVYGLAAQAVVQIPGVSSAAPAASASGGVGADVREMLVEEVRPIREGDEISQILLILKEKAGNRRLVMSVGQSEAIAIYTDLSEIQTRARPKIDAPTSYDLMRSLVRELGGTVSGVVVSNVTNETFHAKVLMNADSRQLAVDSRPSDAIALALRARVPIFAESSVLDKAGVSGS